MTQTARVALITDAASFIGPSVLRLFSTQDVTVVAADPSFSDASAVAAVTADYPNIIPIAQTDPADTVARARKVAGEINILCTGGTHPATKTIAADLTEETTRIFFEKLAMEPLAYVAALAEGMKAQKHGRIVFVTSSGPIGGIPNYTAYASARAALNGAVKSLSTELASFGISVNAVAPNFIATEAYFPKALIENEAARTKILSRVPAKRFGDPMEAAETVAFFALGNSGFVTGQVLAISGGWV